MIKALLGIKQDQTQQFAADGRRIPVTTIQAGPCWVTNIIKDNNYINVQLGFGKIKKLNKAQAGNLKKAGISKNLRFFREIRLSNQGDLSDVSLGQEIKLGDVFAVGDKIRVTGISKGKGFAGVVKRHGFAGGPRTHGQSDRERAPGSIGQTTTPGRVYKGKRMAGRMGNTRVTARGLQVVRVDNENNFLTVKGLVPGAKESVLMIMLEPKAK